MTEISIRTAEIEMKLHLDHIFTTFRQTAESPVRRSRRPVAADKAANKLRPRPQDASTVRAPNLLRLCRPRVRGYGHAPMRYRRRHRSQGARHVDILRTELARGALCYSAKTELGARERCVAHTAAKTRGCSVKKIHPRPRGSIRRVACLPARNPA